MPIDDALEDIDGEDKTKDKKEKEGETKEGDVTNTPKLLVSKARDIIGNVLVDYFKGELPGQSGKSEIDPVHETVIRTLGYDLLIVLPKKIDVYPILTAKFRNDISDDLIKKMVNSFFTDNFILQTDIGKLATREKLSELISRVPELKWFVDKLLGENWNDVSKRFTFSPYLIVTCMNTYYKAFTTLVVENAIINKSITLPEYPLDIEDFSFDFAVKKKLEEITPSTNDYMKIAKQYGVKEILPAAEHFKKICDIYINRWFK